MKLVLMLATLALAAPLAHAKAPAPASTSASPTVGYIDRDRVYAESEAGKKATSDLNAQWQNDQAGLAKLPAASKAQAAQQAQDANVQRFNAAKKKLDERIKGIATKLKAQRHMTEVKPATEIIVSDGDLTSDVIAMMDAEDKSALDEVARLREQLKARDGELAAAKAENAGLAKPAAPSSPKAPPIQPLASKGK